MASISPEDTIRHINALIQRLPYDTGHEHHDTQNALGHPFQNPLGSQNAPRRTIGGSGRVGSSEKEASIPVIALEPGERLEWPKERVEAKYTQPGTRRKGKKETPGWHRIPRTVMRRIVDFFVEDVEYPKVFDAAQTEDPGRNMQIPRLAFVRHKLCVLRLVGPGWAAPIAEHPFWIAYACQMYHGMDFQNALRQDLFNNRYPRYAPPCLIRYPNHLAFANHLTVRTCIICRFNSYGRPAPRLDCQLDKTEKVGWIMVCNLHLNRHCDNCLKAGRIEITHSNRIIDRDEIVLARAGRQDTTEEGAQRRCPLVCIDCRLASFDFQAERILRDNCAREGPVRGLSEVSGLHSNTLAGDQYVDRAGARGSSHNAALLAVEEIFMKTQGKWWACMRKVIALQNLEAEIRQAIMAGSMGETTRATLLRRNMLIDLRGDPDPDDEWLAGEMNEQVQSRVKWYSEKMQTVYDIEDEGDEPAMDAFDLDARWASKLRENTLYNFVSDRIRLGYWVLPSDEVHQLSLPPNLRGTPHSFPHLAKSATHPLDLTASSHVLTPTMAAVAERHEGWINLDENSPESDLILPPIQTVRDLDCMFRDRLRSILWNPMAEAVKSIEQRIPSQAIADKVLSDYKLEDVLGILREKEVWGEEEGSLSADGGEGDSNSLAWDDEELSGGGDNGSDLLSRIGQRVEDDHDAEGEWQAEPRVELVLEDEVLADYGIQEMPDSSPPAPSLTGRRSACVIETKEELNGETITTETKNMKGKTTATRTTETKATTVTLRTNTTTTSLGKRKEAPVQRQDMPKEKKSSPPINEVCDYPRRVSFGADKQKRSYVEMRPTKDGLQSSSPLLDAAGDIASSESTSSPGTHVLTPTDEDVVPANQDLTEEIAQPPFKAVDSDEGSSSDTTSIGPSPRLSPHDVDFGSPGGTSELVELLSEPGDNVVVDETEFPVKQNDKVPRYGMHASGIPWIPGVQNLEELGPGAKAIFEETWREVRARLRICGCSICQRRRNFDRLFANQGM